MSKVSNYGIYILLWIFSPVESKIPDDRVTCIFSESCALPCSFNATGAAVSIQWYHQDSLIFSLQQGGKLLSSSSMRVPDDHISNGNATLFLNPVDIKSKGRYKCVVNNATRGHVIAAVEAPIRMISINKQPSSDMIQCSTKDVYPAPALQWTTEPSLTRLNPTTRMFSKEKGLYSVESIVKLPNNSFDQMYVCKITSKYGTQTWTASLQLQEIIGFEKQNLVIPCTAPKNLQFSTLVWTVTKDNKTTDVLKHDSLTRKSTSFTDYAKVKDDLVSKGNGSLTLDNPVGPDRSGIYSCVFYGETTIHRIETNVDLTQSKKNKDSAKYNLWMLGIVLGLLALLALTLLIKRYRAKSKRRQEGAQADEEMQNMNTAKTSGEQQAENKLMSQP
ncbi:programmed cell death 1 ligand 1 isoform X1 [Misgurnus anguillicaudatus]|uniref:programmed cell death 1 ligand 1 isoform X1 n=2 Tax=Misgurnus anguillicaudatus TaxID=75329 RepID=UPI003CCFD4A3